MNTTDSLDTLTDRQAGHLRHFANLSRQLPNDWSLMQGRGAGQDDFGGYRFQLSYMAYALALTHRHRLPAAPGAFKPVFERLIEKMLLPEVWMYWERVSRGGSVFNAQVSDKLKEEWDPVARDNIMYSAYVQSMALLYNYLFDDDRYAAPGALTFRYWSFFWGGKERRFEYDQNSLNEAVYWQMVESGYVGVACEPNCVFQICNQPAILGFRMHDLVNGRSVAAEVTEAYQKAWEQFGRLGANGHYNMMVMEDSHVVRGNAGPSPWADAWCGTLMNMWNREFVRTHYPAQIRDWLIEGEDGALSVQSAERPLIMGQKVVNDDSDFGWAATWASEMGDHATLAGLERHAERYMAPTWRDGGLFYPRNDTPQDAKGHHTLMEPMCGNVLMGYAALNVPDGFWKLYNEPISAEERRQPALTKVGDGVDVMQARFDAATQQLHFRLRPCVSSGDGFDVVIGRIADSGPWTLSLDGKHIAEGSGATVAHSTLTALRTGEKGLLLDCGGLNEAAGFVLAFRAA